MKKEFNEEAAVVEVHSARFSNVLDEMAIAKYEWFVGLDVHKDTIAVAIAARDRGAPEYQGEIRNTPAALSKLVRRLSSHGEALLFCYEAGPCGYTLWRQIMDFGQDCQVVAPPKSEHIKTDRRDAVRLARLLRSGDLRRVWVPDVEQEAMRDLLRCRADFKKHERSVRQQLGGFVLRHGHHWPSNRTRWTLAHFAWLETLELPHPWQRDVLNEYLEAVRAASDQVKQLSDRIAAALPQWSLAPVVDSLVALRGVDQLIAMAILAELGDISRFDSPKQLMGFLGLVPSQHNSGSKRRSGSITLAGNHHVRWLLVEAAWCYRFPARQTAHLKRKAKNASVESKRIAWRAQTRLCGRYRKLVEAGKNQKTVCVAIARELVGFIWDIVRTEMPGVRVS